MICRRCGGAGGFCAGCGEPDCRRERACCVEARWVDCDCQTQPIPDPYRNLRTALKAKLAELEEEHSSPRTAARNFVNEEGNPLPPGWYWWACFPGCLPDGDPQGPYESEQAAIDAAQENA